MAFDTDFIMYMLECEGETTLVNTRLARINAAIKLARMNPNSNIYELLAQKGIIVLTKEEEIYIKENFLED